MTDDYTDRYKRAVAWMDEPHCSQCGEPTAEQMDRCEGCAEVEPSPLVLSESQVYAALGGDDEEFELAKNPGDGRFVLRRRADGRYFAIARLDDPYAAESRDGDLAAVEVFPHATVEFWSRPPSDGLPCAVLEDPRVAARLSNQREVATTAAAYALAAGRAARDELASKLATLRQRYDALERTLRQVEESDAILSQAGAPSGQTLGGRARAFTADLGARLGAAGYPPDGYGHSVSKALAAALGDLRYLRESRGAP